MSLEEMLDNVVDRDTFLEFVKALIEDWNADEAEIIRKKKLNIYSPIWDNSEWENHSIGGYLEAASAWMEDLSNEKVPEKPTWRAFADFLYAGKFYE